MGGIFGGITKALFGDPSKDIKKATEQDLAFQREGLDYLKSVQAPVLARREQAAEPLMGFYTDPEQRAQFYQDATQDPTYDYLTGLGEESVMRGAAATGGLRGGGTQPALANIQHKIAQNLVNQRLRGLQGFAQQPVNAGQVAQQYSNMGSTQRQGTVGAAQADQAGLGQLMGLGFGGLSAAGSLGWNPFGKSGGLI